MENSSEKIRPETRAEQEKPKFKYSPENPPPLEVLESKIFAVHATPLFPENGILKAGARDISSSDKWRGEEPPSFRPTIHFALGELVQEHSDSNWDENPYAVVSPLENLERQLINIFSHDTFVLGDLQLQEGMILLVPKGTDISKLPRGFEIREYEPKIGLRKTVDSVITEKEGWHIRMKPEGVAIGSVAYIEDIEVNSSKFFQSLFEKYPHISFGTHLDPERGDAFRFGVIEQTLDKVMKNYSNHWLRYSTVEVSLRRSLIVHNLWRLEQTLENSTINPQAMNTFDEKKAKLLGWLNIIDCDLETRQRLGKTFTGAPETIQKMVRARRNNPAKLREFVDERYLELPDAIQESELSPIVLAEMLSGMSPQELEQFKTKNEDVFNHVNLPGFYAHYATKRWIVVKNEQAQSEGLNQLLTSFLEQLPQKSTGRREEGIFKNLKEFLNEESNRLDVALTILRNPAVKKHLEEVAGIRFEGKGPETLRDVIAAHPKTKILFESQEIALSNEQKQTYQLLDTLGQIYNPRIDQKDALTNFGKASALAFDIKWSRDRLKQNLETITRPINTARKLDDLLIGTMLTLYEILRRDEESAGAMWRKFGLEREFRKMFSSDEDFWSSDQSLLHIYKLLKSEKPEKPEQLFLQRSEDTEQQKLLNQRRRMATELIEQGKIGKIEAANPDLEGKWVVCVGEQYPVDVSLLIESVNVDTREVLINAGDKYEKKWVPIKDLRFLSAVSEIVNAPIDLDKYPQ
ncbi:hypothetical protein MYX07_02475 [Patescibacteria group bacterium AH-259-L07]|nr:hypothetical protein [Patescibacteria group bacterium AH-259-L07]